MGLADLVPILMGGLMAATGAYFLAFPTRRGFAGLLGAALLLTGLGVAGLGLSGGRRIQLLAILLGHVGYAAFIAVYPTRVRWRSASGVTAIATGVWALASLVYHVTGPSFDQFYGGDYALRALGSSENGITFLFCLLIVLRSLELERRPDIPWQAARLFYLVPIGFTLTSAGFQMARGVAASLGLAEFPAYFGPGAQLPTTLIVVASWWLGTLAIAATAALRFRWFLPGALMVAGALGFVPLVIRPELDPLALHLASGWGALVTPGLALYAQARYAPFAGEPNGVRASFAVTVLLALLSYAFAFVVVVLVSDNVTVGHLVGSLMGLAAAVAMAALVLPRAQRSALRRAFFPTSNEPAPFARGSLVLGRYRIKCLLAEGWQGRVYEAQDTQHGNARVALKAMVDLSAAAEASALRQIDHVNVVRLVDVVETSGMAILVLEHVDGGTLRALLARNSGRLPMEQAVLLASGVLAGLAAAHAKGIVHRDVKPENVLLGADGRPKLADFGIAETGAAHTTMRSQGLGTLLYLAPELIRGEPGDARSDVYAAGILVHELLTGRRPIAVEADDFLTRKAILTQRPRIQLKPEAQRMEPVLRKALAKDPRHRFADALEMRDHLLRALGPSLAAV